MQTVVIIVGCGLVFACVAAMLNQHYDEQMAGKAQSDRLFDRNLSESDWATFYEGSGLKPCRDNAAMSVPPIVPWPKRKD